MKDPLQKGLFEDNLETKLNKEQNFGITQKGLKQLGFYDLQNIFYGTHNVRIPEAMLQQMNTSEILAFYMGVNEFKDAGNICIGTKQVRSSSEVPFEDMVSGLVAFGYASNKIRSIRNLGYHEHSTAQNALKERMKMLDDSVKTSLIQELNSKYRKSNAQDRVNFDFYDPNIDGKDCSLYRRVIIENIKNMYPQV